MSFLIPYHMQRKHLKRYWTIVDISTRPAKTQVSLAGLTWKCNFFFFFVHPLIRWPIAVADDPPNCPALNKSINMDITYSCRLQTPIVNEAVGEHALLQYLPGCNALWSGNTSKPPCPSGHIDGGDLDLVSPSVWYREEPYISPWPEFKKSSQWWGIFDIFIIFTTRFIKCSALIYLDKS